MWDRAMVKVQEVIQKILTAVFVILSLIVIVQLLMKITGHSPTELQIVLIVLGIMFTFLLGMGYKIGTFMDETRTFMKMAGEMFREQKENDNDLKKVIQMIDKRLSLLEHKIDQL
jgi:Na+-transporting methylmalonyl-CoA/oxaloacetate decarboxylase gamma subunit